MYFIEKLISFYINLRKKKDRVITAEFDDNYVLEDVMKCSHQFIAIDSTGEVFACSKCGYLVKKDRLQKKKR